MHPLLALALLFVPALAIPPVSHVECSFAGSTTCQGYTISDGTCEALCSCTINAILVCPPVQSCPAADVKAFCQRSGCHCVPN